MLRKGHFFKSDIAVVCQWCQRLVHHVHWISYPWNLLSDCCIAPYPKILQEEFLAKILTNSTGPGEVA